MPPIDLSGGLNRRPERNSLAKASYEFRKLHSNSKANGVGIGLKTVGRQRVAWRCFSAVRAAAAGLKKKQEKQEQQEQMGMPLAWESVQSQKSPVGLVGHAGTTSTHVGLGEGPTEHRLKRANPAEPAVCFADVCGMGSTR